MNFSITSSINRGELSPHSHETHSILLSEKNMQEECHFSSDIITSATKIVKLEQIKKIECNQWIILEPKKNETIQDLVCSSQRLMSVAEVNRTTGQQLLNLRSAQANQLKNRIVNLEKDIAHLHEILMQMETDTKIHAENLTSEKQKLDQEIECLKRENHILSPYSAFVKMARQLRIQHHGNHLQVFTNHKNIYNTNGLNECLIIMFSRVIKSLINRTPEQKIARIQEFVKIEQIVGLCGNCFWGWYGNCFVTEVTDF